MKRTVLPFGLVGGVLIAGLRLVQYRFLLVEHSLEIYGGAARLFDKLSAKRRTQAVQLAKETGLIP